MSDVATYARAALAVILLASGAAKLADFNGFSNTVRSLLAELHLRPGLARRLTERAGAGIVPAAELVIALLVLTAAITAVTDIALVVAFSAFTLVSIYGWRSAPQVACKCFGALTQAPFSGRTAIRNLALLLISVGVAVVHPSGGELSTAEAVLLVLTAVSFGLVSMVASRALDAANRPNQPRHMVYSDD